MLRHCLAALMTACLSLPMLTQASELKPEERLQAIRQALVEAAMQSHTRVTATSWMDSQGALREFNRFSSEIKLRDLQLAQYSRGANQEPRAQLAKTVVEPVLPQRCHAPMAKAPLRHVMSLGFEVSTQFIPSQRLEAQQLARFARERLVLRANEAQHWRLVTDPVHARAYDRAMYGHGEEKLQWHLQFSVMPTDHYTTDGKAGYVLRWQARSAASGRAAIRGEALLDITPSVQGVGTPKVSDELLRHIDRQIVLMVQDMEQQLSCDPPTMTVIPGDKGRFTLTAGEKAGLRVGDKVMLSDPRVLPQHALEVGALDGAVLAEVKSVSAYQSELKHVAGRALKNQGAWVAWPYTY